ncbi:transmembrane protein, putative [Medicago truncatula]|uniref:Transmembrane protein, putative n=1 Tax=Medicago truncatula TaxID=3880 RepID=G7K1S6_MEDTR|nr:transmembrane protein, putative [Medicago truncatula]
MVTTCLFTQGLSGEVITGISLGAVAGLVLLAFCIYVACYKKKQAPKQELLSENPARSSLKLRVPIFTLIYHLLLDEISGNATYGTSDSVSPAHIIGIRVEKSGEFSYEQLVNATNNFNMANKFGQGGFGEVYYAELNGEVADFGLSKLIDDRISSVPTANMTKHIWLHATRV